MLSCHHGWPLRSYTILVTQRLFVAAIPAIPFSPLSFLAFAIHGFWLLLGFIVSQHLIIAFSLGICLVLFFSFSEFYPIINCWPTPCARHSAFAKEDPGPSIQPYSCLRSVELSHLDHFRCRQWDVFLGLSEPTSTRSVLGTDSLKIIIVISNT